MCSQAVIGQKTIEKFTRITVNYWIMSELEWNIWKFSKLENLFSMQNSAHRIIQIQTIHFKGKIIIIIKSHQHLRISCIFVENRNPINTMIKIQNQIQLNFDFTIKILQWTRFLDRNNDDDRRLLRPKCTTLKIIILEKCVTTPFSTLTIWKQTFFDQ